MEDSGLGNLIFYIILAVIGLIGSFSGKKKKTARPGTPGKTLSWPEMTTETDHSFPDVFEEWEEKSNEPTTKTVAGTAKASGQRNTTVSGFPVSGSGGQMNDGEYDEPMARSFSGEGRYQDAMADRYSTEGSMVNDEASRFSSEGSMSDALAAAFSSEGVSAFADAKIKATEKYREEHTDRDEIFGYDYDKVDGGFEQEQEFDLRKAVLYSSILERREYSF